MNGSWRRCTRGLAGVLLTLLLGTTARADAVDTYVRERMRAHHIDGLALAVVKQGRIVTVRAYGTANLEWKAPATPDTLFQIASTTKALTGTALMTLVQQGRLRLDAPVTEYLPTAPPAWSRVTLRHLATHTAGLTDDAVMEGATSVAEAASRVLPQPPATVGERARYLASDSMLLAHILETVEGKPFPDVLAERVLRPAGMTSARFDDTRQYGRVRNSAVVPGRAGVYHWSGSAQRNYAFFYPAHSYAAGGLYASINELARFAQALDQGRLLTPESLAELWRPQTLASGAETSYAVNWVVGQYRGRRTVGHSGGPALADLLRFPDEQLTLIVLTNQHKLYPNLAHGLADLFVPPPAFLREPGIADPEAALTRTHREVVAGLGKGLADAALFSSTMRETLVPELRDFGPMMTATPKAPTAFVLLSDETQGEVRTRQYRAVYGNRSLRWRVTLDREGLISNLEPKFE